MFKIKLSHDPNNTTWTNNTDGFGHRMLKSQGWSPGEYLGAKNASHAEYHTAANASHIRVVIKDNNLGLGAKIGSGVGHGECTGLDVFQNLLGRLNGKEEKEIEREQKSREDLKRAIYAERKWGSVRFVRGGVLVGDKIQELIEGEKKRVRGLEEKGKKDGGKESESVSESESSSEEEEEEEKEKKKSKKRKRSQQEDSEQEIEVSGDVEIKKKKSKKDKKEKKSKTRKTEETEEEEDNEHSSKRSKKSKSKSPSESTPTPTEAEEEVESASARKARKKEKKEKKRREKEAAAAGNDENEPSKSKSKKEKKKDKSSSSSTSKDTTPSTTVPNSGRSTPMGIHSIRSRHIAQKRMASMDLASLNQIFMIKSQI
ncbi:hypothetical protein CJF31_00008225 [Rutstroemia sp. NJR-2017a BVV2]|nr:hypothetical protein CJF31_00008225 [Rutstroemia sp. NJR-2017a BVV2]